MAGEGGIDLATLGIRVDSRPVTQATAELDKFTASGQRAERAARSYQNALNDRLGRGDILAAAAEYDRRFNDVAETTKKVEKASIGAGAGMYRLNNSMVVLARQATGTHPIVGQLADVIGTFAIGTAKMVPILAGIAALGFGMRLLARDAREAKVELDKQLDVLRKLSGEQGIAGRGGTTQIAVEASQAEARRIAVLLQQAQALGNQGLVEEYTRRLAAINQLTAAGLSEIAQTERDEKAKARRDVLRQHQQVEAATKAHYAELERLAKEHAAIERTLLLQRYETEDRINAQAEAERVRQAKETHDKIVAQVQATQDAIKRQQQRELDALEDLKQARQRANDALISSLENVGRAYGGVADQMLALVAASLSLERLPLVNGRDRAIAFGSAGLAGVGFGATTGSPVLGGLGGAASGFALAGPAGAVIGAVGGIVGGLLEHGRRAREAARQWKEAFRQFSTLFETPTNVDTVNAQFRALTGGRTIEDVRGDLTRPTSPVRNLQSVRDLIETYDRLIAKAKELDRAEQDRLVDDLRVRSLRARGLDFEADKLQQSIEQERELARARELGYDATTIALLEETQAQERLALAARETTQALTSVIQALNAPSGLNLALYQYRAGIGPFGSTGGVNTPSGGGPGQPPPPPGGGAVVNVYIDGSGTPEDVAYEVIRELGRIAGTGIDPFQLVTR